MGNGCCKQPTITEGQKEELFTAGAKEMMKLALRNGYDRAKNPETGLNVKAPGELMEKARKFALGMHEASEKAKEKVEDTVGSGTDKANEVADKVSDLAAKHGGMLGGMLGKAAEVGVDLAGKGANLAASGVGLAAEKTILVLALAMDEAIGAIDKPFAEVGKDIFKAKESEIVEKYIHLIKTCRIPKAAVVVRGEAPFGVEQYNACKPTSCVDTFHAACQADSLKHLREVVTEEIQKHTVTKVWAAMIEKINACLDELRKHDFLKDYVMDNIQLDLNEYIITEVEKQFHEMMQGVEMQIRPESHRYKDVTDMPMVFHLLFSGEPAYDAITYEMYTNMRQK
jgi:hypothetical protein